MPLGWEVSRMKYSVLLYHLIVQNRVLLNSDFKTSLFHSPILVIYERLAFQNLIPSTCFFGILSGYYRFITRPDSVRTPFCHCQHGIPSVMTAPVWATVLPLNHDGFCPLKQVHWWLKQVLLSQVLQWWPRVGGEVLCRVPSCPHRPSSHTAHSMCSYISPTSQGTEARPKCQHTFLAGFDGNPDIWAQVLSLDILSSTRSSDIRGFSTPPSHLCPHTPPHVGSLQSTGHFPEMSWLGIQIYPLDRQPLSSLSYPLKSHTILSPRAMDS